MPHKRQIEELLQLLADSEEVIYDMIKLADDLLNQLNGNYDGIHEFYMSNYTYTILDFVVMNDSVDLMKLFVEKHKIDINEEPGNGVRLLVLAINKNNYDMLEYLLNNIDTNNINNLVEIIENFGYYNYVHVLDKIVHKNKNNDIIELLTLNGATPIRNRQNECILK